MMIRSPRSTPTRQNQKPVSIDHFTNEFFKRSLFLAATLYETPQTTDTTLPSVHQERPLTPSSVPQIQFSSPIADLRLRRRFTANWSRHSTQSENEAIVASFQDTTDTVNLSEVFGDSFVRVPFVSKLDDTDEVQFRRTKVAHRLDMRSVQTDATQRLIAAEERGQQNARKRKYVLEHHSPKIEKAELNGTPKSERSQPRKGDQGKERRSPHGVRF
jgi:hypothetical protein